MPVTVDDEQRARESLRERITRVRTHHQIRREVGAPGPRVVEIVLGVERVVADETAKDSRLQRKHLADRREIRNVRWSKVPQKLVAGDVRRRRGKTKELVILAGLRGQLDAPT